MILVTGATGFLGAELVVQLLESEEKIRCIKRETSLIPKILIPYGQKIEWVNADILDFSALEDAFENINQVYHCAAIVSFDKKDVNKMIAINVVGTENIVNLCLANAVDKLVHVSSVAALGNVKPGEEVTENNFWDAYDKNGNYAVSKYRSEMEVWRGMNEGLKAVIVNPSVIIGENLGENGSGKIFSAVKNGLDYYTNGSTGFVDVKDVASAMISLMNSDIEEERFILSSENYSYKSLLSEIAIAYGIAAPSKSISKFKLMLVDKLSAIGSLFLKSNKRIGNDAINAAFNKKIYQNHKIVDALKFEFIPVKDSIRNTVKILESNS